MLYNYTKFIVLIKKGISNITVYHKDFLRVYGSIYSNLIEAKEGYIQLLSESVRIRGIG